MHLHWPMQLKYTHKDLPDGRRQLEIMVPRRHGQLCYEDTMAEFRQKLKVEGHAIGKVRGGGMGSVRLCVCTVIGVGRPDMPPSGITRILIGEHAHNILWLDLPRLYICASRLPTRRSSSSWVAKTRCRAWC